VSEVRIEAEIRSEFGKGAARRLRRDGKIPAVIYGHGADVQHVALPGHELMLALKNSNALLNLQIAGGDTQLALPRSVQRDPVRHTLEHVDLLAVRAGEKVTVDVVIHPVGTCEPGGLVEHIDTLQVEAESTRIPSAIEVDIQGLAIGSSVQAKDVTLPEGVTLAADPDLVLVHVISPKMAEPSAEETAAAETVAAAATAAAEEAATEG